MARINELMIPNVTSVPAKGSTDTSNRLQPGQKSEFGQLVQNATTSKEVQMSGHAVKRLQERNIAFDGDEYVKLQEALGKLRQKGGHDSLVITSKAAYVMDVDKGMVVTAVDRDSMGENVFTKIDSTIFMN